MTIRNVIDSVDGIKPHAFSNDTLTMWINEVEGMVQTDVMLINTLDVITYTYSENADTDLLVKPPYDKIYVYYLAAMIDFANNEYQKYQNTLQMFNKFFGDYTRWYSLNINPANGRADIVGYYLSAYGLAVKHGYEGSESDWLESLRGPQGKGWIVNGFVDTVEGLPKPTDNSGVGLVYGVGVSEPYDFYIFSGKEWDWRYVGPFSPVIAESWARGGTGAREGEDTDNAMYYSDRATTEADRATTEADRATTEADRATTEANRATTEADKADRYAGEAYAYVYGDEFWDNEHNDSTVQNNAMKFRDEAKEYANTAESSLNEIKKAFNKNVNSKAPIAINDVDTVETVVISAPPGTQFTVYGKNIIRPGIKTADTSDTVTLGKWTGKYFPVEYFPKDSVITASCKYKQDASGAAYLRVAYSLDDGSTWTNMGTTFIADVSGARAITYNLATYNFTGPVLVGLATNNSSDVAQKLTDIQIELSDCATPYSDYIEGRMYSADAAGKANALLNRPSTTILSLTEELISFTYSVNVIQSIKNLENRIYNLLVKN